MRKNIGIYVSEADLLPYVLMLLGKARLKYKIMKYDDKSDVPHVIINTPNKKGDINKVMKKKFKINNYALR